MATKESIYQTMHWSNPGYRNNNQGMAILCDWLHLLRYEDGTVHEPWTKRPKISVIEIGCGNGKLCSLLSSLTFDVLGTDEHECPARKNLALATCEFMVGSILCDTVLETSRRLARTLTARYDASRLFSKVRLREFG